MKLEQFLINNSPLNYQEVQSLVNFCNENHFTTKIENCLHENEIIEEKIEDLEDEKKRELEEKEEEISKLEEKVDDLQEKINSLEKEIALLTTKNKEQQCV